MTVAVIEGGLVRCFQLVDEDEAWLRQAYPVSR